VSKRYARIAGWGKYLPERVMTNMELEALVDTSDEWIRSRSGIVERRIAAPQEAASDLGLCAAEEALRRAGATGAQVDLVIVATATPDYASMPPTASLLQDRLGATSAGAFDLNAVCSGFVYALVTGAQFVENGLYRNVLVVGTEVFSRILDWQDRGTCVLFGDGAGAVLLQPTERPGGLLAAVLGSDGSGACHLVVPAGGSREPTSHDSVDRRDHYMRMNGREVFRFATRKVAEATLAALDKAGLGPHDLDLLIPHQANQRIIDGAAKRLELAEGAIFSNVGRYGNTSAASVPVALCEAIEQGAIREGAVIGMVAFGAGLSWAAAIWRWNS
jgi:3-oxoacyl-[acyl-carrier-protein] synthase-3